MLMPVQFTIRITKEIIEHCKKCGIENKWEIGSNCAVAFALKDIFPAVYVTNYYIFPFGIDAEKAEDMKIAMPVIAQQFIKNNTTKVCGRQQKHCFIMKKHV